MKILIAPDSFKQADGQTSSMTVPPAGKWWKVFRDAELYQLVEAVEKQNPEVRAALDGRLRPREELPAELEVFQG